MRGGVTASSAEDLPGVPPTGGLGHGTVSWDAERVRAMAAVVAGRGVTPC
ncbi:hypothetical protein ABZ023_26820 [Streptomyces sp. NPDC006367]